MIVPTRSYESSSSPSTSSAAWAAISVRTSSVSVMPRAASHRLPTSRRIGELTEPGPLAGVEQRPLGGPRGEDLPPLVGQAVAAATGQQHRQ